MTKTLLSPRLFSVFSLFILTGFFPFFSNKNIDTPDKSDLTAEVSTIDKETDPTSDDSRFSNFFFIENKGQWDENIWYKLKTSSAQLFVEKNRLNFLLISPEDLAEKSHRHAHRGEHDHGAETPIHCHRFYIDFVGASPNVSKSAIKKLTPYYNYLIGNDPSKHASYVGLYEEIFYNNLYNGIDLRLYNRGANIKYDYLVEAGANPNQILTEYSYADKVFLKEGKLHIQTSVNEIVEQEPYAYQEKNGERVKVACDFKLENNQLSFVFPEGYDESLPLVIDPELVFGSYSAASEDNWGNTATYDDDGNLYGGSLAFGDYPTTPGAFIRTQPGDGGIFNNDPGTIAITKFSADGTSRVYSTFIGGDGMELPHSMIVNSQKQLVVLGTTSSDNYPTPNGFDTDFNGGSNASANGITFREGSDIIVSILNESGTELVGSTYIGGGGNDGLHLEETGVDFNYSDQFRGEVIVDDADNIYVASVTASSDFPTSSGAFQQNLAGDEDAVIFKLNPTASDLIYSTYYGGRDIDAAFSIKLDEVGNAYFVGSTNSSNLPTTNSSIEPNKNGSSSAGFVGQLSSDGSRLNAGTFLNDGDFAYFLDLDDQGDVYVLGQDLGRNYPVEGNVYSNSGGATFLHKLNSDFSQTQFSTVLGSNRSSAILVPSAFLVDVCNRIYISGWGGETNSPFFGPSQNISGMPTTSDAFQSRTDGSDFYLMVLKPEAEDLEYATYFGGGTSNEHVDGGTSRFDKKGIIYQAVCAGCGGFDDFPTTTGAVSRRNGSRNCNLGVFKFDFQFNRVIADADAAPNAAGCAPVEVNFSNSTTGAVVYEWDFGDGGTSSLKTPTHTFVQPGSYSVRMIGRGDLACVIPDTTFLTIDVYEPLPGENLSMEICEDMPYNLSTSDTAPGSGYLWSTGDTARNISVNSSGVYWTESLDRKGVCPLIDSFFITAIPNGTQTQTLGLCEGQLRMLESKSQVAGVDYVWQDGSRDKTFEIDDIGTYWVVADRSGCQQIDTFIITEDSIILDITVLDIDCIGQDSGFVSARITGGTLPYEYSLNQADFSRNSSFDNLAPGSYRLEARDQNGCIDIASAVIDLPPSVEVNLGPDQLICLGDSTDILAQVPLNPNEVEEVIWTEFIKPDCLDCLEQNVKPVNTTQYGVWIKSTDGCSGVDSVLISVEPKRPLFVPAAFSPNNDGINDEFVIYSKPGLVATIHIFQVFDRWGNLLFKQENFQPNDPAFGWNGMYQGKRMDPAVFAWHAEVEFIDGFVDEVKGDVTLVFGR